MKVKEKTVKPIVIPRWEEFNPGLDVSPHCLT